MVYMRTKSRFIFGFLVVLLLIFSSFLTGCVEKRQSISFDGLERSYLIHVPASYNEDEPVPLVVVLHGGGGNAEYSEDVTGFSEKSDEEGFIVVYPDGNGFFRYRLLTWNAGFCCGYALENNIDDVGFIETVVDHLMDTYSIDSKRIYATGMSNGGMMTYRLGAELSDIFAAIAPVAGSIGGQATEEEVIWRIPEPDHPVSVISFHGMKDYRVPYDGGRPTANGTKGAYSYFSVNDSISFWLDQNNCISFPKRTISESKNIINDTWSGGIDGAEVTLYTIVNGNHSWPGGKIVRENGDVPTNEISATEIIWDFFKNHPKL